MPTTPSASPTSPRANPAPARSFARWARSGASCQGSRCQPSGCALHAQIEARGYSAASGAADTALRRRAPATPASRVFLQLVAQGADRDAEDVGRVGAVAEAVAQGVDDQLLLDLGDGRPTKARRGGLGGASRRGWAARGGRRSARPSAGRRAGGWRPPRSPGPTRQQHRAVHGVLELADVAGPAVAGEAARGRRPTAAARARRWRRRTS